MIRRKAGVLAALATITVAGCGGGHPVTTPVAPGTTHPAATTQAPIQQVALTHGAVSVFPAEHIGAVKGNCQTHTPPCRLSALTPLGSHRALLVEDVDGAWIEVSLPTRPNGTIGWVHSSDVTLAPSPDWIKVDLAHKRITISIHNKLTTGPVAIGAKATPTPIGVFYVTDRVSDPGPAYGSFALGLSAHSEVLDEFAGHDGQVGVHGTNVPSSIGRAVSHGCIRVSPAIDKVLTEVPLGTRVTIF